MFGSLYLSVMKLEIVWEGGSGVDEDVEDYWFDDDGTTLIVQYYDGSQEDYPYGNVTEEVGDSEEI